LNGKTLPLEHDFDFALPISCDTGKVNFTPSSAESSGLNIRDTEINNSLRAWKVPEKPTCQVLLSDDEHLCVSSGEGGEESSSVQSSNDSCVQLPVMECAPLKHELGLQVQNWSEAKEQRKNKYKVNGGSSWILNHRKPNPWECELPKLISVPSENISIPPQVTSPTTPSANPNPRSHASNRASTLLAAASENSTSQDSSPCNKGLSVKSIDTTTNEEQSQSMKNKEQIMNRKQAVRGQNAIPKLVSKHDFNVRPAQQIDGRQCYHVNNCRCGSVQAAQPIFIPKVRGGPLMFYVAATPSLSLYGHAQQQPLVPAMPYQLGSNRHYAQQQQYFYSSECPVQHQFYDQEFQLQQSKVDQYRPLISENVAVHNRASMRYYYSPQGLMVGF